LFLKNVAGPQGCQVATWHRGRNDGAGAGIVAGAAAAAATGNKLIVDKEQ